MQHITTTGTAHQIPEWIIRAGLVATYCEYLDASDRCKAAFAPKEQTMITHTTVTRERPGRVRRDGTRGPSRSTTYHITGLTGATVTDAVTKAGGQTLTLTADGREFTVHHAFADWDTELWSVAAGDIVDVQLDEPLDDAGRIWTVFEQSLIRH